jgi:hypothetical protein
MMSGDEFEGESDFQGPVLPWMNYKNLKKYNPARHDLLENWKTPMLIIHSDLDYRCVVTDGIAAFGVLQMLQTPSKFLNFPDEVCLFQSSFSICGKRLSIVEPLGAETREQPCLAQDCLRLDKRVYWEYAKQLGGTFHRLWHGLV